MKAKESSGIIIFGASGDLTSRKLIPALFELFRNNHLGGNFFILGTGRKSFTDKTYRDYLNEKISENIKDYYDEKTIQSFLEKIYYISINTSEESDYEILKNKIIALDNQIETNKNFIFYLATPPHLYKTIAYNLSKYDLNNQEQGWKRLIIEKPFGYDLNTAIDLNKDLLKKFNEDQLYRIDHYLGKETVQNILVTRFSNIIFEPLWNRNFVHHVEITSSESIGVENRGGYYDKSGALRDMVQNHLLQVVGLVAMEPPTLIDSNAIRNEIVKVFQSIRPLTEEDVLSNVILGQYTESTIRGEKVNGYRQEPDVDPKSKTETFAAIKFNIDNWRWSGIPFYVRTGKRLPTRVTEIVIHFKHTPHHLFCTNELANQAVDQLIIRIQPDEGILLKFGMKVPGAGFKVQNVNMDFHYSDLQQDRLPSSYERLLLDCLQGDSTLYARKDTVEESWKLLMPVLNAVENNKMSLYGYPAGTWGPSNTDSLIEGKNTMWRYPCKNLSNDDSFCEL
ncbi:glucose-6-phosphate dehydrogenase [Bacteroidota bacterium]